MFKRLRRENQILRLNEVRFIEFAVAKKIYTRGTEAISRKLE